MIILLYYITDQLQEAGRRAPRQGVGMILLLLLLLALLLFLLLLVVLYRCFG